MLNKEEVLKLHNEIVNESFSKFGDSYRGQSIIDIPKSLINAIRSKSKKELNIDTVENYSDISICDLIIEYVKSTYINIDSIPVSSLFGIEQTGEVGDISSDIVPDEQTQVQPVQPVQPTNDMEEVETELNDTVQPTNINDTEENQF